MLIDQFKLTMGSELGKELDDPERPLRDYLDKG